MMRTRRALVIGPTPPPIGGDTVSTQKVLASVYWDEMGIEPVHINTSSGDHVRVDADRRGAGDVPRGIALIFRILARLSRVDVVLLFVNSRFLCTIGVPIIAAALLARRPVVIKTFGGYLADRLRGLPVPWRRIVIGLLRRAACRLRGLRVLRTGLSEGDSGAGRTPEAPVVGMNRAAKTFLLVSLCAAAGRGAWYEQALADTLGAGTAAVAPRRDFPGRSLYSYINGEADVYFSFGLITCAVRSYTLGKETEFEVMAFEMESPSSAFGVFRQVSSGDSSIAGVGTEAAMRTRFVAFWSEKLYVEVTDRSGTSVPAADLAGIASALAGRIGRAGALPAQLGWLPAGGMKAASERYFRDGFAGRAELAGAFGAEYESGGTDGTFFVKDCASADSAKAILSALVAGTSGAAVKAYGDHTCTQTGERLWVSAVGKAMIGFSGTGRWRGVRTLLQECVSRL